MMYDSMTWGGSDMTQTRVSLVQEKGQITIPADIRRRLGLKKGDYVAFIDTEQGVLVAPQEIVATAALDRIGEALRDTGVTLADLIASGRDIRGEIVKERYGLTDEQL